MKKIFFLVTLACSMFASTLYMSYSSNVGRLNPLLATDSTSSEISSWVFDSLFKYDKNGQLTTQIAKNYRFIDQTTLEIVLRDDVYWSDGVKITSKDVVFTYEFAKNPKVFTPYVENFRKVESVKAKNEQTVIVKYKEPYFKALETWLMPLIPKHILKDEKEPMTSKFNFAPLGSGPYILKKLEQGSDIEFVANKRYFDGEPKIQNIKYKFLPDSSSTFMMLKTGALDIGSLTPMQLKLQSDKDFLDRFRIVENPGTNYTYLGFNLKREKFKNPKVREAISKAIDRKALIDLLFFGHAKVATGPFLEGSYAYNPKVQIPKRDVAAAKRLLKEAGYGPDNPLAFEISTNSNNPIRMLAAQIIQRQLKEAGIIAKIRAMEWQAFLNTVVDPRNFDTVLMGWSMPLSPDAYSIWHSSQIDKKAGFNFIGYKNVKVDELIEKAEKSVDRKVIAEYYQEIYRLIVEDNPYIFLYVPNSITAVSKKIKNVEPSIVGIMHNQIKWEKME
jgi:peptide/nickel transport system substrate-binding protein